VSMTIEDLYLKHPPIDLVVPFLCQATFFTWSINTCCHGSFHLCWHSVNEVDRIKFEVKEKLRTRRDLISS
jgi:hypothetical protein